MKKTLLFLLTILLTNSSFGQEILNDYKISLEKLEYIKKETIGGKLDFELKMKDADRPFYMYDRIMYNRKDFGIFLWGAAVKKAGIVSNNEAIKLWEEIKQKKMTKPEKKALIKGYKAKLE